MIKPTESVLEIERSLYESEFCILSLIPVIEASSTDAGYRMDTLSRVCVFPPALKKIVADTHVIKYFTNRLIDDVLDALGPVIK